MPFGIGLSTLRACVKILLGFRRSGWPSAGNGAAMRAAILGVWAWDRPELRRRWGVAIAEVTHTDPRGAAGALFVADLAAACVVEPKRTPLHCLPGTRARPRCCATSPCSRRGFELISYRAP